MDIYFPEYLLARFIANSYGLMLKFEQLVHNYDVHKQIGLCQPPYKHTTDLVVMHQINSYYDQQKYETFALSVMIYDISDRLSFEELADWISRKIKLLEDKFMLLVGYSENRTTSRVISYEEGLNLASLYDVHFMEVQFNKNDTDVLLEIVKQCHLADPSSECFWLDSGQLNCVQQLFQHAFMKDNDSQSFPGKG